MASKKKGTNGATPLRVFTKLLRVKLEDSERHEMALDLAGEEGRLDQARNAKEEATKTHNGIIKGHEARVQQLATTVNQGWDYREVEVEEREDFDGKRIYHVRVDTAEEIWDRPMSEEERQRPLLPA
jgi:hypothetical protein